MTVTNGKSPSNDSWYFHCVTATHICGDQQWFEQYIEHTNREEREICDCTTSKVGKATRHGDLRMRLRLPRGKKLEVAVRNVLPIKAAHNSLSQQRLMDRGMQIVPVNGYEIKIYDKVPRDSARGWRNLIGVAHQVGGLFLLDVKFPGKRYRAKG
jgi:hypothetical protein